MKDPNTVIEQIKAQLDSLDKTTIEPTWDRVEATLKRNKRRRYATLLLTSIGSLAVVVLFFNQCIGVSSNSLAVPSGQQELQTAPIVESSTSQGSKTYSVSNVNAEQTTALQNTNSDQTTTSSRENSYKDSKTDYTENTTTSIKSETLDSVEFLEGAVVKTTYYYYNDASNTEVVTQNKAVIDSILESDQRQQPKDSMQE